MKKVILSICIGTLGSIALLSSCSKGDYNSGDMKTGANIFQEGYQEFLNSGRMTAKVNGNDFAGDIGTCHAAKDKTGTFWVLKGYDWEPSGQDVMILSITSDLNKGTYNIDMANVFGSYQPKGSSEVKYFTSGKIEITEKTDTRVKGTYEAAADGYAITEGKFDLPIIN